MKKDSYIYIAGHNGLVGNSILRALKKNGFTNLLTINRSQLDLTNSEEVSKFFSKNKIDYFQKDGLHLNEEGNFIIANEIFENLVSFKLLNK